MNDLSLLLIKAAAGIALFFLPYRFFLRNEPNLLLKRLFLLSGLVISFILPLLKISLKTELISELPVFSIDIKAPDSEHVSGIQAFSANERVLPEVNFLLFLYFAGVLLMLLRYLYTFISWKRIRNSSSRDNKYLLISERNEVFSFFNYIHIPASQKTSDDLSTFLLHEKAHIRQLHYLDLIIAEIALLLTWFSPFTWLIIRMIKENHEHLADREVLSAGIDPVHYRTHLLNQTLGVPVFLFGQSFNHSLTKKRFEMMKNKKSERSGRVKLFVLLPAVLFSLGFLNISTAQPGEVAGIVKFSGSGETASGASIIIKGTTTGTVSGEDGKFNLTIPGKSEIVVSFVGYKSLIKTCKPGDKLVFSLEPNIYELDIMHQQIPELDRIQKSLFFGENTVLIVDGVKTNDIGGLDASQIEHIDVYKDPDQIKTKYPEAAGKESVVEITTRKGKQEVNYTAGEEIFFIIEDMPEFPGGQEALGEYIYSNLSYPSQAAKNKTEGRVFVQFVVNHAGKVDSAKVIQSTDKIFDKAALDVFEQMPDWKPGQQRGKPVSVMFTVPVHFKLPAGTEILE